MNFKDTLPFRGEYFDKENRTFKENKGISYLKFRNQEDYARIKCR